MLLLSDTSPTGQITLWHLPALRIENCLYLPYCFACLFVCLLGFSLQPAWRTQDKGHRNGAMQTETYYRIHKSPQFVQVLVELNSMMCSNCNIKFCLLSTRFPTTTMCKYFFIPTFPKFPTFLASLVYLASQYCVNSTHFVASRYEHFCSLLILASPYVHIFPSSSLP